MSLKLADTVPDFTQDSTQGPLNFYEWAVESWVVLFSHPKDFTPVCTTELGTVARLKPEFDRRGVKVLGLSVDPAESHVRWADDIEETQGTRLNFPLIADHDRSVSNALGLIHPGTLALNAALIPAIAAGLWAGRWCVTRVPQQTFDALLLCFAAIAALRLIGVF